MNLHKEKETITSRERVAAAFARTEGDRVPVDFSGNPDILRRLCEHFGLKKGDKEGLYGALGVDFRELPVRYIGPRLHAEEEGKNVDPAWGIRTRWVQHESGGYMDYCDFPLKDAGEEEVAGWPMPDPDHFNYDDAVETMKKWPVKSIHIGNPGLGDIINTAGMLRTMEKVMFDLIEEDPGFLLLTKRRMEIQLEVTRRMLEKARGRIDFMWLGEDLGSQNGPIINPELYRKLIKPHHAKFTDLARSFGIPVMIHSCGSSSWAFEDFLEIGITGVDTLQPEAAGMDPAYLKKTYGERMMFHGCISTAGPLAYGTKEEAVKDAEEKLAVLKTGGGYCFSPTHLIQDNSPTENVLGVYETVYRSGWY
ncbi:MAG: uroporphyrinogen decarboxylase family protein [Spirochaetia bacterium]